MEEGLKLLLSFSANAVVVIDHQTDPFLVLNPSHIPVPLAKLLVSLTAVVKVWSEDQSPAKLNDFKENSPGSFFLN